MSFFFREATFVKSDARAQSDGRGALDEAAVSDVGLTLFVKEDDGATDSVDGSVASKLEDVGGTGGSGGRKGSIVVYGADRRTATVEEEGFAATGSVDEGFSTKL